MEEGPVVEAKGAAETVVAVERRGLAAVVAVAMVVAGMAMEKEVGGLEATAAAGGMEVMETTGMEARVDTAKEEAQVVVVLTAGGRLDRSRWACSTPCRKLAQGGGRAAHESLC